MGISLKPEQLKRYKDIAWLFFKYGQSNLIKKAGLEELLDEDQKVSIDAPSEAAKLTSDLEKMGPTFIKLGQLLSTRVDLLPLSYVEALSRLQDSVEPFSSEEAQSIITTELGVRISKGFAEFDPIPIAAASLGQVHRAVMRDGRSVAVKVQRPGIRERVMGDLDALDEIAALLDGHTEAGRVYEFQNMLKEFRRSVLRELDYRLEARNLLTLAENIKDFESIVVPHPIADYTTSRVLTLDYIQGKKITSLSPLAFQEVDGSRLAEQLFRAYLKQILVDGFFHADPHPGNVLLTEDGRIALLDLGMVASVTPEMQEKLLQLMLAVSEGRGSTAADLVIALGRKREDFNETEFRRQIADFVVQHQDRALNQIDTGTILLALTRTSVECGIVVPPELTMLGKTLLNLDQIGHTLDPNFNPTEAIRDQASTILRQRMLKSIAPGEIFGSMIEVKDFIQRLPGRINKILDAVVKNEVKIRIEAFDERLMIAGIQKIANRITMGLILAALIVGAALLMRVETSFRLLGYPGFAIVCFLLAASGGIALVISILMSDERSRKKRGPH